MSIAAKGKKKSPATIEKMRNALKGKPAVGKALAALHAYRHLAWTPEAQEKKSKKLKGRDVSAWIHKVAEKLRGRPATEMQLKCLDRTGKKQTPEQVAKRVASRKATLLKQKEARYA